MHPTFVTLSLAMLAGAFIVGSMIGLGRRVGGMRSWGAILAAASVVGGLSGSVMVYAAVDHNPQGAFVNHETGSELRFSVRYFPFMVPGSEHHRNSGLCCRPGIVERVGNSSRDASEISSGSVIPTAELTRARRERHRSTLQQLSSQDAVVARQRRKTAKGQNLFMALPGVRRIVDEAPVHVDVTSTVHIQAVDISPRAVLCSEAVAIRCSLSAWYGPDRGGGL